MGNSRFTGGIIDIGLDMSSSKGLPPIDFGLGTPEPPKQSRQELPKKESGWGVIEYFAIGITAIMLAFLAYKKLA